jgi:hypothetical protein
MSSATATTKQNQVNTARYFVIVSVVGIFALLGTLIAYNSGASAEESQNSLVLRRIASIGKRVFSCEFEVLHIQSGAEIKFSNRKDNLDISLDALKKENEIYVEQNKDAETKLSDCREELGNEKRRKTGASGDNATEEILRLRYSLKTVEGAIENANASRMVERQRLLRIVEAYSKENEELMKRLKEAEEKKIQGAEGV